MSKTNKENNFLIARKYEAFSLKLKHIILCSKNKEAFKNCIINDASDCSHFLEAYKKVCGNKK